jgi:uncharacterized protein (DUF1778 family)
MSASLWSRSESVFCLICCVKMPAHNVGMAAKRRHRDMTGFEAERAFADQRRFVLSPKAWKEFTAALDRPPQTNQKMRELLSKLSILEG